jgi:hypothetical protein
MMSCSLVECYNGFISTVRSCARLLPNYTAQGHNPENNTNFKPLVLAPVSTFQGRYLSLIIVCSVGTVQGVEMGI